MKNTLHKLFEKIASPSKERDIKCVVIGDSGVGKTKLIGSFIYNKPEIPVTEMNQLCHTPSIFSPKDSQNLKFLLGKVPVHINIWDTFGNHRSNREYSYKNADVIIICYSIADEASLENASTKWIHEAKFYCPKAPIILVGTQLDRRHTDPSLYAPRSKKIKTLREYLTFESTDKYERVNINLVEPEHARQIAERIGASACMEVSVVTKYGINSLFQNAAQLTLMRGLKTDTLQVHKEFVQKPYLPKIDFIPEIKAPILNTDDILFTAIYSNGFQTNSTDVMFQLTDGVLYAESIVLVLGSVLFNELFSLIYKDIENIDDDIRGNIDSDLFVYEKAFINSNSLFLPRGFESARWNGNLLEITVKQTNCTIFKQILQFYYCGQLKQLENAYDILTVTNYLQLNVMFEHVLNTILGQTNSILGQTYQTSKEQLCSIILKHGKELIGNQMYSDLSMTIPENSIFCHKSILVQRCSVFKAMFEDGKFQESCLNQVDFRDTNVESFLAVLEYLYTGDCKYYGDLHGTLQLANFLCLPRLVTLCEEEVVKYIKELQEKNDKEMYTAVIASYNIAQFHNAPQLATWCLHFMATNYNAFCKEISKEMKSLDATTQKYLEEHRWPPVWYLKEQDYYEKTMKQLEQEQMLKENKKSKRKCKTCF